MSRPFDEFAADFHDHATRDPNACVMKGVDRRLDELPDPSQAEAEARVAGARELLRRLDAFTEAELADFDTRLDADLARLALEHEIHGHTFTFNGRTQRQQMPKAGDDVGDGIFLLFINDPRPPADRLADITGRIERVPEYLEAQIARLDTPVARWVSMDVEKVSGLPQLLSTILDWAGRASWPDMDRLRGACERAELALRDYAHQLERLPTSTNIHAGDETCRRIIALRGIDKTPEELHRLARDFLAETRTTIEELRGRLVTKYRLPADTSTEALQQHLSVRHRVELDDGDLDGILRRYEAERDRILSFIRERELFPVPDDQDMRIMRTPPFMAPSIPAGAMMPPPPFREGVRRSLIYLTLSEELRDEHTEITIPSMMIHEGIPGHHLQLTTAAGHPSIIRRHVDAMEHAEGWTTMLEDYMLDVGYLADIADEVRFCGKRDLSRIGARVAIDLYFMSGDKGYLEVGVDCDLSPDDPFQAAGNLLREVTGFVPGRVQAELNWYSQERGYPLSYLTGNRMVWELKADLARSQAGTLDPLDLDRRFHELYLNSGNMPVSYLRRVFEHQGLLG